MTPITVIPIILAIAIIPPVLTPDSDPIEFLQGMIPSIHVACAQIGLCEVVIIPASEVGTTLIPELCIDSGCQAAGGTCHPVLNSLPTSQVTICECIFPSVGGWFLQVDKPSILIAGAQMTAAWMMPIIVSAIGIGIVIARKF